MMIQTSFKNELIAFINAQSNIKLYKGNNQMETIAPRINFHQIDQYKAEKAEKSNLSDILENTVDMLQQLTLKCQKSKNLNSFYHMITFIEYIFLAVI